MTKEILEPKLKKLYDSRPELLTGKSLGLTKIQTPVFRMAFPDIFEARAMDAKSQAKFGVTMLFSKKHADLSLLEEAHDNAVAAGVEKLWGGKKPKLLKSPFRDGDEEEGYNEKEGFPGNIFVRASSLNPVGAKLPNNEVTTDPTNFRPGYYARAIINAYAYDTAGNRGVAFGLEHIQLVCTAKTFDGRKSIDESFESIDDSMEDDDDL